MLIFQERRDVIIMNSENLMFVSDVREPGQPVVPPWKIIEMDPDFSGQWLVTGDLDNDGELEFVAARNHSQAVTAMSAYKLDGTLLWKWGKAGAGRSKIGYDVPAQVYDIDGDGKNEVIFSEPGFLVVLDGLSGRQKMRFPLPKELDVADCIAFANIRGGERASDILIKTRYTKLWAYSSDWKELWNWAPPDGHKTCHHPTPVDLDGDGRDEIMAGYTMLDDDGTEMWTFNSEKVQLTSGHLDCCRVAERGNAPEEFRFAVTCCGANLVAMLDGVGNTIWEIADYHFESIRVAPMSPTLGGQQVFVDIDHGAYGDSPAWLIDIDGNHVGTYITKYNRHHRIVDWNGDGLYEIVLANALAICDGLGNRIASLGLGGAEKDVTAEQPGSDPNPLASVCDVTGNGVEDVVLHTDSRIFVYLNPSQSGTKAALSEGSNFTLY